MKNLFLGLMMLAGTSMAFANETTEKVSEKSTETKVTTVACYVWATDVLGNRYLKEVRCPKVIILSAIEQ